MCLWPKEVVMQNTFITIRTYYDSVNAHLDKMKLNSAGLDCILLDEHTNVLRSVWAIVLIRLQVSKPSIPGILTSNRIKSGFFSSRASSADSPLFTTSTLNPFDSRYSYNIFKFAGVSSTNRIVLLSAVINNYLSSHSVNTHTIRVSTRFRV